MLEPIITILGYVFTFVGGIIVVCITQRHTDKRHGEDLNKSISDEYKNKFDEIEKTYKTQIGEVKEENRKNIEELKDLISELKATVQQSQAVTELKIENLTEEVRMHNNFARRMPVVEEKVGMLERMIVNDGK